MEVKRYLCGSPRHLPHSVDVLPCFGSLFFCIHWFKLGKISALKYFRSTVGYERVGERMLTTEFFDILWEGLWITMLPWLLRIDLPICIWSSGRFGIRPKFFNPAPEVASSQEFYRSCGLSAYRVSGRFGIQARFFDSAPKADSAPRTVGATWLKFWDNIGDNEDITTEIRDSTLVSLAWVM